MTTTKANTGSAMRRAMTTTTTTTTMTMTTTNANAEVAVWEEPCIGDCGVDLKCSLVLCIAITGIHADGKNQQYCCEKNETPVSLFHDFL